MNDTIITRNGPIFRIVNGDGAAIVGLPVARLAYETLLKNDGRLWRGEASTFFTYHDSRVPIYDALVIHSEETAVTYAGADRETLLAQRDLLTSINEDLIESLASAQDRIEYLEGQLGAAARLRTAVYEVQA